MSRNNFYVFTADHSGLPLAAEESMKATLVAIRPQDRNGFTELPKTPEEAKQNEKRIKYLNKNGTGIVNKMWADQAMSKIKSTDLVIFDQIYGWQYGEQLRKQGVKVQGGTKNGFILETERRDTLALLKKMGMDTPLQKYFGPKSSKAGIDFLKSVNNDPLFAFKSDNPKIVTQVAYDNNDELIQKLVAEAKDIDGDGFLLQQKVDGVEAAVETWYVDGKPVLSNVDIEAKKKYNETSEVQTGCAMGLTFMIPVDHPLRERANQPFDEFVGKYFGTGILDLSFIYEPKEDKLWALEVCGNRLAYNAFYAMIALLNVPIGEFFAKYLHGEYKSDIFGKVFSDDIAASLRIFNEDKTPDQRVEIDKDYRKNFWLWDCYKKGSELLTTGDESLGIVTATGENPESALAKIRESFFKLHMPTKWARDDFDDDDYPTLPLSRYHQMKRLNLI